MEEECAWNRQNAVWVAKECTGSGRRGMRYNWWRTAEENRREGRVRDLGWEKGGSMYQGWK